jgi:hypothetical protein
VRVNERNGSTDQFDIFPVQGNFNFYPTGSAKLSMTDSIRLDLAKDTADYARYCTIRMHHDPITRLLSGKISFYRREPERESQTVYQSMEIEFKDLAWYKERGTYHLYAASGAMSHISLLKMKHGHIDDEYWVLGTYQASEYDPDFVLIELAP